MLRNGSPGVSRRKGLASLQAEARRYTREALKTCLELMRKAKNENVRLSAVQVILDRGWGKAVQALAVDAKFANKKLTELTDTELLALEERLAAMGDDAPQFELLGADDGGGRLN